MSHAGFWLFLLVDGLSYSMLLYLLAAGFSLIFGMMGLVNLAQGSFYLLAGYLALSLVGRIGVSMGFWVALVVIPCLVAGIGLIVERLLLRHTYSLGFLGQVLVTFGLAFAASDVFLMIWGGNTLSLNPPADLSGATHLASISFPNYRLFLIAVGLIVAMSLWVTFERTKLGDLIRATVDDAPMLQSLGYDTRWIYAGTFMLGIGLAGLAGVVGAPVLSLGPGIDSNVLINTLIVVVLGGLGSMRGALAGALVVGEVTTITVGVFPQLGSVVLYVIMILVLLLRPQGLVAQR